LTVATEAVRPTVIIVPASPLAQNLALLRQAVVAAYEDNCFGIAKGAAYSLLLSLFPVLTTLTSILVQVKAAAVVYVIAHFFREVVPPGTEDIVLSRLRARGGRPVSLSVLATLLSLWAGSGAMMTLMEGFQAAYRVPRGRPFIQQRLMAMALVLSAAVPAVAASLLILSGNRIESALLNNRDVADLSTPVRVAWRVGRYVVAFCTTTFVTGLLFYFGPNHRTEPAHLERTAGRRFWRVWPGALLSTILWLLATGGFAWYVHYLANYNFFYGGIGAVIVLTIWLYLISCIILIGCEFNAERERSRNLSSLL
jgi:membrane protein